MTTTFGSATEAGDFELRADGVWYSIIDDRPATWPQVHAIAQDLAARGHFRASLRAENRQQLGRQWVALGY